MRKSIILALAASSAVFAATLAEAAPGDRLRERIAERRGAEDGATRRERGGARSDLRVSERLTYGSHENQRILFYAPPAPAANVRRRPPPLAVYIHGGGWSNGEPEMVASKPAFFTGEGWAFASVGYRMLPDTPVEEQARDIGRALVHLRQQAARLGYDPDRILLTGHSAGAHLTALVSSDPQYAGSAFAAIRGALLNDGACYDVPAQMQQGPRIMIRRTYIPAFSEDPARQRELSPITHAGGRDVGDWLMLYTTARDDARDQSEALARALRGGGAQVQVFPVETEQRRALSAHREINVEFGAPGFSANDAIRSMLRRIEG